MHNLLLIRLFFVFLLATAGWYLRPFGLNMELGAASGLLLGLILTFFESQVRRISLKRLIGAAIGCLLGIAGAYLISIILASSIPSNTTTVPFLQLTILLFMTYIGLLVGSSKGEMLNLGAFGGLFGGEPAKSESLKILDTSVIIDGRIADIVETGFVDGTLIIPQFVLRELQLVADSADSMKRNRGRRGLDMLQRMQKMTHLKIQILDDDFPNINEVDMKLLELAKNYNCKVITNDFNLNKVAQLHRVAVLNINELANALKPIVLPGESMRVFILKEGKEYNQGVAYLDDGTMVVVDNAKRMISRTIDISVTSVLQTTAGKMIFGRFDDRVHAVHDKVHHAREQQSPPPAHAVEGRGSVGAAG